MSARYSNTSSRGREIVVETVSGSTGPDSMWPRDAGGRGGASGGPAVGDPHRVAESRTVNDARAQRLVAFERAAQLAQHDLTLVEIDLLPDQRRSVTPPTALEIR